MSKKIFAIGDINIDFTLKEIFETLDLERDLGKEIIVEDAIYSIGGSGFNFIKSISSFGGEIDFYGMVGNDFYGKHIKGYCKKENIGNSLIINRCVKTGITTILPLKGDRILFTFIGGNKKMCIKDLDLEKIKRANHVHISSFYLMECLQPSLLGLLADLKSCEITISFDTGYDPNGIWQKEKIFSLLRYIDIFLPNEVEAISITEKGSVEDALNLLSNFCPIVVIKLGGEGLIAKQNDRVNGEKVIRMKPYSIEVVDTSCCGDSFDAGFVYQYINGINFEESLLFANACGALQATKPSNYKFKNIEEIEDFMSKHYIVSN